MIILLCMLRILNIVQVYALNNEVDCKTLRMGQYLCPDPDASYVQNMVDPKTQQLRGCTQENKARSKYYDICSKKYTL